MCFILYWSFLQVPVLVLLLITVTVFWLRESLPFSVKKKKEWVLTWAAEPSRILEAPHSFFFSPPRLCNLHLMTKNHKPQDCLSLGNVRQTTFWLKAPFRAIITAFPQPNRLVWKHVMLPHCFFPSNWQKWTVLICYIRAFNMQYMFFFPCFFLHLFGEMPSANSRLKTKLKKPKNKWGWTTWN